MSFFGSIAHPTHLIWLYFGVKLLGLTLDLHDDPTGTRWTLWLQDIGRIYPRICNFASILIIFGLPEVSTDPPWCLQMDANMQVSFPGKNKLEIGISAGCVYCGNPKKTENPLL